jgi:hypothetical protein
VDGGIINDGVDGGIINDGVDGCVLALASTRLEREHISFS